MGIEQTGGKTHNDSILRHIHLWGEKEIKWSHKQTYNTEKEAEIK